jgi:mercuric ion transport protein
MNPLKVGIIGTIITAICCFTPALVLLMGVLGLGTAIGYLDLVLLPALGGFILFTGYALWRQRQKTNH